MHFCNFSSTNYATIIRPLIRFRICPPTRQCANFGEIPSYTKVIKIFLYGTPNFTKKEIPCVVTTAGKTSVGVPIIKIIALKPKTRLVATVPGYTCRTYVEDSCSNAEVTSASWSRFVVRKVKFLGLTEFLCGSASTNPSAGATLLGTTHELSHYRYCPVRALVLGNK